MEQREIEYRLEHETTLDHLVEDTVRVVGVLLGRFPELGQADRACAAAATAVSYVRSVADVYLNLRLQGCAPASYPMAACVTMDDGGRAWALVVWNDQDIVLDFQGDKVIVADASDPRYSGGWRAAE
jgi:hypothetical protein